MHTRRWWVISWGLMLTVGVKAQDVQLFSIEPTIAVEGKVKNSLDYFFQLASESRLTEERVGEEVYESGVRQVELQAGVAIDFTTDLSGTASFLYRLRTPFDGSVTTELRPTQHLTYAIRQGKYRFRQRLRADERFRQRSSDRQYEFDLRLRYRLSVDFPLEGDRLDQGEFYLNANAEFLYTPTQSDAFFYREWRGYSGLGYQFNNRYTLELGTAMEAARISRELGREYNWLLKLVWAVAI